MNSVNVANISRKQMAKLLGVSVSKVRKIYNSLIAKGYIKELGRDGAFQLTVPDPKLAATIPYNPIRFKS